MWEITSQGGPFCLGGFLNTVARPQKPETDLRKVSMALDKSTTLPMNALRTKHSLLSGTDKPAMSSSSGRTSHRLEKACQWGDFGHSVMLCAPGPIVPGPQVPGRRRHYPTRRQPGVVGLGDRNGMRVWGRRSWGKRALQPGAALVTMTLSQFWFHSLFTAWKPVFAPHLSLFCRLQSTLVMEYIKS